MHTPLPLADLVVPVGRVDLVRGVLTAADGSTEVLPAKELALLAYLSMRPGRDVDRYELLREVWGYSDTVVSRAVDNAVRRLRARIETDPSNPRCLLTAHGVGYRWVPRHAAALPRPVEGSAERILELGQRVVDLGRMQIQGAGEPASLTALEVGLLEVLADAAGEVVAFDKLRRSVWDGGASQRSLVSLVHRLRDKIESDPSEPEFLIGVRGAGYKLVLPEPEPAETSSGWRPPPNPFLGRESELAEVAALLEAHSLVTVLGPAGVGKTRLAQELATAWTGHRIWCQLDGLDGSDVARSVAARVDATGVGPADIAAHLERLDDPLLVLNTAEHALEPVARLVDGLFASGCSATVLVTSQVPLGLRWERQFRLEPLSAAAAMELFRDRAHSGGDPDLDSATDVRTLVDTLDCLPLAIELAAGACSTHSLGDLTARLAESRDLLESHDPTSPARHRSLTAALDGCWALLDGDQRDALTRLSAFRGSFDLEAADAVLGAARANLTHLVRRSLVHRVVVDGGTRYALLDSVRAHAARRGRSEVRSIGKQLLRAHYVDVARSVIATGRGTNLGQEDAALLADLPNLLVASETAEGPMADLAVLVSGWLRRTGDGARAVDLLTRSLDREPDPLNRARLLNERGLANLTVERTAEGERDAREALRQAEELADEAETLLACSTIGLCRSRQGDHPNALEFWRRSQQIADSLDPREPRNRDLIVSALNHMGVHHSRVGSFEPAESFLTRALMLCRSQHGRGVILLNLSLVRLRLGDLDGATRDAEASEGYLAETPYRSQLSQAVSVQGDVQWARGDFDAAEALFVRACDIARAAGSSTNFAHTASDFAGMLVESGQVDRALAVADEGLDAVPLEVHPVRITLQLYRAVSLWRLGRQTEARVALAAAAEHHASGGNDVSASTVALFRSLIEPGAERPTQLADSFDVRAAVRIVDALVV